MFGWSRCINAHKYIRHIVANEVVNSRFVRGDTAGSLAHAMRSSHAASSTR
jgi:hypothetical protein